jgi:hypothetical protein
MAWSDTTPTVNSKVKAVPGIFQDNWDAVQDWTGEEHKNIPNADSGAHLPGECCVLGVGTTTALNALSDVACAFAWDTTLKVFKYNTGAAWLSIGGPMLSGVVMVFYQDTAPAGWTISNVDDKLAFITKGSAAGGEVGGGVHSTGSWTISGFDSNVGSHTLNSTEMPSHSHGYPYIDTRIYFGSSTATYAGNGATTDTGNTGGGAGHVHPMATHGGTWRPSAYNCIQCTKD